MPYDINSKLDGTRIIKKTGHPLWRYMELWKFIDLLDKQALYFPSYQKLGDQYEGKVPEKVLSWLCKKNADFADGVVSINDELLSSRYCNCWLQNKCESYAFWKIYTKEKFGVAIKTTIEHLKESLMETEEKINIIKMEYDNNPIIERLNFDFFLKYKKEFYSYENEVRCVYMSDNCKESHVMIPVDLNQLIDEVYITEFAFEKGLHDILLTLKEKYNLGFGIKKSQLKDNWL